MAMSEREAFIAMKLFLEQFYAHAGNDMETLIADITLQADGQLVGSGRVGRLDAMRRGNQGVWSVIDLRRRRHRSRCRLMPERRGPGFIANSNGEVIRVPEGATGPRPAESGKASSSPAAVAGIRWIPVSRGSG